MTQIPEGERYELALAILLWRSLRANFGGRMTADHLARGLAVTAEAERMADAAGCRAEFFELLLALPVLNVSVANLDDGGKRRKGAKSGRNGKGLSGGA